MIESNIINWIDLGDSMQSLDVYGKKKWIKFFNFMRILVNYKSFSVFFYIILQFFFFLQILMLNLINIDTTKDKDSTVTILTYISKVVFLQQIITDSKSYKIAVIIVSVLTLVMLICIIFLVISIKIGKFYMKAPIYLVNLINVVLLNYLVCPAIEICIMSTRCQNGNHFYLNVSCFSHRTHIVILVASILNLLFYLTVTVALSLYYNEIGSVNETKVCARINCNYEVYSNISKILMFVLTYFMTVYGNKTEMVYQLIIEAYIFLNALIMSIYVYKTVLFYDNRMNVVNLFGWIFVAWFSFVMGVKTLLNVEDTIIFHLIGWIILGFIFHFMEEYRAEYLLTDFNIFEAKTLKEIELFNQTLLNLMDQRSIRTKTLLVGIVKKFEDYTRNSPELLEKFTKLSTNEHLKKKFNSNSSLPILSIVYIIYDHHLDKSLLKNDILLNMSYFLMNKFKNATFSVSLCSKFKVVHHKHLYFKYLLMEEIKEYLVNKLSKSNNKESIKHVQIGSVILYNIYMDLFKIKIYDAACNQIDYFDILKNNVTTPKTTENFLKIGEDILTLRKEILKLWEKIVELNPFSDESEKDYMLYLETILQDDILARTEAKKFSTLKTNKLSERNNIYHSMFIRELSSIILIDGYSTNGKILYTTPNFPALFTFSGKEILNMSIDDLLPNVIQTFHKELVDDAIKFSNVNYIFNSQKDMLLKGKSGGIFNIKLFVKCVPNLSFGLIYMAHITKMQDHNFIIVLDKDFKINGLTDMMAQGGASYTMNNNYGLTQGLCGHHIALVLPEILLQMECKDQKFYIPKSDIDLKGNLYPVSAWKELDNKVDIVLDRIKQCGKLQNDDEQKRDTIQEYEELIKDVSAKYQKPFSVFYKIVTKTFLNGKHKYHRIYITNDLIALNENSHSYPSVILSGSGSKKDKKNESKLTSLGDGRDSGKQIKLKVKDTQSEGKGLLEDKKEDDEKKDEEGGDGGNKKKTMDQPGNDFSKPSSAPSSILTKSSIDSASFNKLKNGILEKKEVTSIKIMKYLCLAFGVFTILLIVLNSTTIEDNFGNLNDYLQQNLFFNHAKISVSCVYLSTVNLKWVKDIKNLTCTIGNNCKTFYSSLLSTCIHDIKTQKENSSYFYEDFKNILSRTKEIELEVYSLETKDVLTIDIDNLLNLLISNGLKLNANLDTYIREPGGVFDINSKNILNQSIDFVSDVSVSGFDDKEKEKNVNKQFSPIPICLIVDCVIFVLLIFCFGWLIFKLYNMEIFYLERLINFTSPTFDAYLKRLEDLKKKLRNDNGEDDEKINGDLEMGELNSKKGSKKEEEEEEIGKEKKRGKKGDKDDDKEEKDGRKKGLKKRGKGGNRANKLQQQKNEKKKIMSKFFLKYNLFFTFKVMIVLLLAVTYYIVITLIENQKKNDYLSFDSTTNAIEEVYKGSFDAFLRLKTELAKYENAFYDACVKNNSSEQQQDETTEEAESTDECVNNITITMDIPSNNDITTPKLGNLLMPLVNDLDGASSATTELNNLYNSDACLVLFETDTSDDYKNCSKFWSSILIKGMEQSITQMSVVINTVIDELNSLQNKGKTFSDILNTTSAFSQYELFVEYYLFKSYMKTVELFELLKEAKVDSIYNTFQLILYCYVIGVVLLFFILLYFVYSSKFVFNSFLNFIGILPVKYLLEKDDLYKDILKLEQHIF